MFLQNKIILQILLSFGLLCCSLADDCSGDNTNYNNPLSLCQEFQAIRDLADKSKVQSIIQKHLRTDCKFRKAVKYMSSPNFNATLAVIDNSASYQQFVQEFKDAGVNTADIDSIANIFQCVVAPLLPKISRSGELPALAAMQSRSLDTVARELFALTPEKDFMNFMKSQLAKNVQFAEFYEIVRDADFCSRFIKSLKNRDICPAVKKLRRHQIDLAKLFDYSFALFQRGPKVY